MSLGLAWAFLAVPLVVVANNVDPTLARVLLAIAAAPIILAGIGVTLFVALAPFFVRETKVRALAFPLVFGIAYALGGWTFAFGYAAAVLVVWAAVSVLKIKLPASAPYRRAPR